MSQVHGENRFQGTWLARTDRIGGYWGLLDKQLAEHDTSMSQLLKAEGMDVHTSLAIQDLLELPDPSSDWRELADVEDLKRRGLLLPDFEPVIQYRQIWRTRIEDLDDDYVVFLQEINKDKSIDFETLVFVELMDALTKLSQETNRVIPPGELVTVFTQKLANQIAVLHNADYLHRFLHHRNVGTTAQIVDLDGLTHESEIPKEDFQTQQMLETVMPDGVEGSSGGKSLLSVCVHFYLLCHVAFRKDFQLPDFKKTIEDALDTYIQKRKFKTDVIRADFGRAAKNIIRAMDEKGFFSGISH